MFVSSLARCFVSVNFNVYSLIKNYALCALIVTDLCNEHV